MQIWKQLLLLCLIGGTAYGGYLGYQTYLADMPKAAAEAQTERPVTVEIAVAEERMLQQTIEAVGTTRALQSIDIVPEADGRLTSLRITPGARVEQGDVLARLDDTIQRADLTEAEAILETATNPRAHSPIAPDSRGVAGDRGRGRGASGRSRGRGRTRTPPA